MESFATQDTVEQAEAVLGAIDPDVAEFGAGLELEPASSVKVQRPSGSPVHLECQLHAVLNFGNGHLVIGRLNAVAEPVEPVEPPLVEPVETQVVRSHWFRHNQRAGRACRDPLA